MVVAADVGEAKDAGRFAKRLDLPLAIIDKRRYGDDEKAQAGAMIGDVRGKHCLLVDDEIATGGTIFGATDFLLEHGASSASRQRWCTRCSRGARSSGWRRRGSSACSSPTPFPSRPRSSRRKIEVLSVAPLLATAITQIHDGASVSELFS